MMPTVATGTLVPVSAHLFTYAGAVTTGVIRDGARALVIDCGEGDVIPALRAAGVTAVEAVLFTHHHRDQACGVYPLAEAGARILVPAAERAWFAAPEDFWHNPAFRWHLYNVHPHHQMLTEGVRVDGMLADGETITWGPARITALATPGHTDGSMSYLVEVDGRRVAFAGDLIYDAGRLWELSSLQKGNSLVTDYHGFLGAREELAASLRRVLDAGPELLIPAHGQPMDDPPAAVAALLARLEQCYEEYVAISALRYYFPPMFAAYQDSPLAMPFSAQEPPAACLRHDGTTWILHSESGAVFVMDCGSEAVVHTLRQQRAAGEITAVEGLWITHYHDDHVDGVPAFQQAFDCPTYADRVLAEVISHPLGWRLTCTSPGVARVDHATVDEERWQWREFTLTAYHFPGQTRYHGGLLVEGRGLRMFFAGDSFTPGGIDDYCAHNRNFLGEGVGFQRCLDILQELKPAQIYNPHVDVAFRYTDAEIDYMRANLRRREASFGALFPWDHANYGMDDFWFRAYPYEQSATPGTTVELQVIITNHSTVPHAATVCAHLPRRWQQPPITGQATIPPKTDGLIPLTLPIPADTPPGRHVITIDVEYAGFRMARVTEGIIDIQS